MKSPEVNSFNKETEPVLSVLSWIENEEWKKDPKAVIRLNENEEFIKNLDFRNKIENSYLFAVDKKSENSGLAKLEESFFSSKFSTYFESDFSGDIKKSIKDKIKNRNLIDLGTGKSFLKAALFFKKMEPLEFIGVEKFNKSDTLVFEESLKENNIKGKYVVDDILLFLSKLPDNSANFFMAGVDFGVISNEEYWERLKKEILRTIYKDGIFVGYGSDIKNLEGFENKLNTFPPVENFVFLKKENE